MLKTFKTQDGKITTIEISEEGKVTYAVGKKKTTFDMPECASFTYEFSATDEKVQITEDMLMGTGRAVDVACHHQRGGKTRIQQQ